MSLCAALVLLLLLCLSLHSCDETADLEDGLKRILYHSELHGHDLPYPILEPEALESSSAFQRLTAKVTEALALKSAGDPAEAFQLLLAHKDEALALQHSPLLFHLGECYLYGEGTPRDERQAFLAFNESAALGNPKAQRELGFLYSTGRGVARNGPLSLLHYTFAASAGDLQASLVLAHRYKTGAGVEKVCARALYYYKFVASKVVRKIEEELLEEKVKRVRVARDIKSVTQSGADVLEEDNEELLELYKYNARSGDLKSQISMGNLYLKGSANIERDFAKAFEYFSMAKEKSGVAKGILGLLYLKGYGVEQSNETALQYFEEGAKQNDAYSLISLGRIHLRGDCGVAPDHKRAFSYFLEESKKGHPLSHYYLGECYFHGYGVDKDFQKAHQSYQTAAGQVTAAAYKYALVQMIQMTDATMACDVSVPLMKEIAEKAPVRKMFEVAHYHYQRDFVGGFAAGAGADSLATLYYEKLAEMGYEVAQHNAAWIFHNYLKDSEKALKYYKSCAAQGNAHAHLQIGNFYFYGYLRDFNGQIVGDKRVPSDMKKAAQAYQQGSQYNEPEALFNLGYMHQEGIGIAKDRHLAKRYYDLSLVHLPSALWAVKISVFYLQLINFVETYRDYQLLGFKWDSWLIGFLVVFLTTLLVFRKTLQRVQPENARPQN